MLSIVIPVYNNYKLTAGCLASIFKNGTKDLEIIVVDNNSTDYTETLITYLIEEKWPIKYLKQSENLDYLKGANIGWKAASGENILHLNNDTVLPKECIPTMLSVANKHPKIGVIGSIPILNGIAMERPFRRYAKQMLYNLKELGLNEKSTFVDVDLVGFGCGMVKKEVSDNIGYFDERFTPCMYEQEDFCLRAQLAGYRLACPTNAFFVHYVGATTQFNAKYYQSVINENRKKYWNKRSEYFIQFGEYNDLLWKKDKQIGKRLIENVEGNTVDYE